MQKIIIFGAAGDGINLLNQLRTIEKFNGIKVVGFADNDSRLHGTKQLGIDVYSPKNLSEIDFDLCIISPIFGQEIRSQLERLGIESEKIQELHQEPLFSREKRLVRGNPVGRYSYYKAGCMISNTSIGNFCHIGDNCLIGLIGHAPENTSTYPIHYHFTCSNADVSKDETAAATRKKNVVIKNDVYIGEGVVIFGGVTIGNGAIIGSRAVVTKDVDDYAVVAGIPAKPIKKRFDDSITAKLLKSEWWNWPDEKVQIVADYFAQPPEKFIEKIEELGFLEGD